MTRDSAEIRNPDRFDSYHLYTRTHTRDSENYHNLVERSGREPNVIYPEGWYDWDIDRIIAGTYCVHHGIQEIKRIENLEEPYEFTVEQREQIGNMLVGDNFKIEYNTRHFTTQDNIGVYNEDEDDDYGELYPISRDGYRSFLKMKKQLDEAKGRLGKGLFLYMFFTDNVEYFSVINFTGSEYATRNKPYGNRLETYLKRASHIVEPCFNELLLFMLEAYARCDFFTLYDYLTEGVGRGDIRLADNEKILVKGYKDMSDLVCLWFSFRDTMEWLLECIHFDTIFEEAVVKRRRRRRIRRQDEPSYLRLVILCKSGEIFDYIMDRIGKGYEYYQEEKNRDSRVGVSS